MFGVHVAHVVLRRDGLAVHFQPLLHEADFVGLRNADSLTERQ